MFFIFFFYDEFKRGMVCRVTRGRDEGKRVVVDKVEQETLWCYENKPVTHRVNGKGVRVIDFDPACVLTPYSPKNLEITSEIPVQTDGWGASYRSSRLWL